MQSSRGLPRASFAGIEFPISKCRIIGGLRDHVHEYPGVPGGAIEKLGRKLYVFEMDALFHDTLLDYGPGLWPANLSTLRHAFEIESTDELVIPTIGAIQAYCFDWSQTWDAKIQSGESVPLRFREDTANAFLAADIVAKTTVESYAIKFATIVADGGYQESLFDQISNAAAAISSIGDQVELYGNRLEAKALGLARLCNQADASLKILQHPVNHRLLTALHDLWASALRLQKDALRTAIPILPYVVPHTMAISDVARAVYGDASRAVEILQTNSIEDPFSIPGGTVLKVFAAVP